MRQSVGAFLATVSLVRMMSWRSYKTEKLVGGLNVFGKITVCLKFKMSLIITICEGFSYPY